MIKKLLLLSIATVIGFLSASAQINYVDRSFQSLAEANRATSGTDIGQRNMTDKMIEDWKFDADGEDVNAILVLSFENMSPEDIKLVNISKLSNEKMVSFADSEIRETDGAPTRWFYIPEDKNSFDIDISHPKYGTTRIPGVKMQKHNIYVAKVRADGTVSISITSNPTNAQVYFDQQSVGNTPLTLNDVMLGKHEITLRPENARIAETASKLIDVTLTNTTFDFPMYRKRGVMFQAEPNEATLEIIKDGRRVAHGTGTFTVPDLEFGEYLIKGYFGTADNETHVTINDVTSEIINVKVIPSRAVTFLATQNNQPVSGADVTLDGSHLGKTPMTLKVNYGKHTVSMNFEGYTKSKSFDVSEHSDASINLKLPNRLQSRHNLFDIDYNRREWGIAAYYVNRTYILKEKGYDSENMNFWLDPGSDNGFRIGIAYQGYYGYGQGLSTGLYYQGFFGTIEDSDGEKPSYTESALYLPLQYQFRLPFAEDYSIFVNAGAAMSLGLYHSLKYDGHDALNMGYGYNDDYGVIFPKAFDCELLFGGGIQLKALQIDAKYGMGLINQKGLLEHFGITDAKMKSRTWSVGLSLMF